jgi:hypothetical protein
MFVIVCYLLMLRKFSLAVQRTRKREELALFYVVILSVLSLCPLHPVLQPVLYPSSSLTLSAPPDTAPAPLLYTLCRWWWWLYSAVLLLTQWGGAKDGGLSNNLSISHFVGCRPHLGRLGGGAEVTRPLLHG